MVALYTHENKDIEKELNLWATFYMTFNDNNENHCIQALNNAIATGKIEESVESIRKANVEWIHEIMNHGHLSFEILKEIPEAEEYFEIM